MTHSLLWSRKLHEPKLWKVYKQVGNHRRPKSLGGFVKIQVRGWFRRSSSSSFWFGQLNGLLYFQLFYLKEKNADPLRNILATLCLTLLLTTSQDADSRAIKAGSSWAARFSSPEKKRAILQYCAWYGCNAIGLRVASILVISCSGNAFLASPGGIVYMNCSAKKSVLVFLSSKATARMLRILRLHFS